SRDYPKQDEPDQKARQTGQGTRRGEKCDNSHRAVPVALVLPALTFSTISSRLSPELSGYRKIRRAIQVPTAAASTCAASSAPIHCTNPCGGTTAVAASDISSQNASA